METPEQLKFSPSAAAPEPERVSRSGRKIKPKRFLDEEVGQEEEQRDRRSISDDLPRKIAKPSEDSKKVATVAPIDPDKSGKRAARVSSTDAKKASDKNPVVRNRTSFFSNSWAYSQSQQVLLTPLKAKDGEEFVPPTATVSPMVANTGKKIIQVWIVFHFSSQCDSFPISSKFL